MKIYFMGISGTAMGNAAILMKNLGHDCVGSDQGVYPPMSDALTAAGIPFHEGFNEKHLIKERPDLVVVGNVVSRGNSEIEWLLETREYPYISLPNLLGRELLENRTSIVVSGTHGKTTTTTIGAYLAQNNGVDCGYLIGGVPNDFESGAHCGELDSPFYIEGDEYDSAFFDKRSKFILYHPNILLINNVEFDHADIYRDLEDVMRSFRHVLRIIPRTGHIVANADDPNVDSLIKEVTWTKVITVGVNDRADVQIVDFKENSDSSSFTIFWQNEEWERIDWRLPGIYNARNATMAAVATALACSSDNPFQLNLKCLSNFKGVKRRQEIIFENEEFLCIEDFGHHPTAIKGTLKSLRQRYPKHYLITCFEPRSNTAVKNVFQDEFTEALSLSDVVLLGKLHRSESIPLDKRLDVKKMSDNYHATDTEFISFEENMQLLEYLSTSKKQTPTLVCFFSNGSFDGIVHHYQEHLKNLNKSI